jgi:ABC-type Fe3+-hydroxamate transport system substrate-binding protein
MQFIDQMNRTIRLEAYPQRIVSLVPSQTELLYDLGLTEQVVGITKFCIHPEEWFRNKTRIGGTKKVHFDTIHQLKPDLIIANKEENTEAEIKELMQQYPVWISDISTLEEALDMIQQIGLLTNTQKKAEAIIESTRDGFQQLAPLSSHKKAAYFIWKDPLMSVNNSRFIHEMMQYCGFENVFAHLEQEYPLIEEQSLIDSHAEVILLSSEPFPFEEKHIDYFQQLLPKAKVVLVDGEAFSWYGSRLNSSPAYFQFLRNQLL